MRFDPGIYGFDHVIERDSDISFDSCYNFSDVLRLSMAEESPMTG